ncbi:MAG: hypothetical protein VB078_00860 [Clostridiaceae bacterium]|nr:hypothetical protein [Clostridiaceae bacterium]
MYQQTTFLAMKKNKHPHEHKMTEEDFKFALFGGNGEITDEMYGEVKRFAQYVRVLCCHTYGDLDTRLYF